MATKISSIYDNLVTLIQTAIGSDYIKLPNPYLLDENAEVLLRKAFAIGFGDGTNTEKFAGCKMSVERAFPVLVINQIAATDHDTAARATAEKALMEDVFKIIKALDLDNQLSGQAADAVFSSDGGITPMEGKRGKYFMVESQILVEYIENLN